MATVILAPVGAVCNLACRYCYHGEKRDGLIMSRKVAGKIICQSMELFDGIRFIWHGGEPLLAGLDFYRYIVNLQRQRANVKVENTIQTNGTLLTDELVDFFRKQGFGVSVSLDGPKQIHDRNRYFHNRDGSFDVVWPNILKLKKAGILSEVLSVVTSETITSLEKIFDFFVANGIFRFELSPCFDDAGVFTPSVEQFDFFVKLFQKWAEMDNPKIQPRIFWGIVRSLLDGSAVTCAFKKDGCAEFLGVNWNGDLFPCFRFVGESEMSFGNILKDDLKDILSDQKRQEILAKMTALRTECQNCEWLRYCGGGCPAYTYNTDRGFGAPFYLCQLRKKLFAVAKEILDSAEE